jgi:L-alanine-DL-glutamate epimerase-like enolase superfamily enzyme
MSITISAYQLWKIEVPTGRLIGDCTCHYDTLDVLLIRLETNQGHHGWGFGEAVSKGVFAKSAPWILPMRSLDEIQREFDQEVWPVLQGKNPLAAKMRRPELLSGDSFLPTAVRMALWDLIAQMAELPLYQLMGGSAGRNRVRAYGSGLDFHLSEGEAVEIFKNFVARGFKAVKVKVGHPDVRRDLRRLQAVRGAVGTEVEIAIDANEAWTCEEAIQRVELFQDEGIQLAYVEDPLPRTDVDGLARLNAAIELDVVGHDYILNPRELRRFVERQALSRLRVAGDPDIALACADISAEFGVPLIFGNSLFELSVHAATALPQVDRIEFSDLAWNLLPRSPIRFEDGYAIAPSQPGHGLDPDPEMLRRYSRPEASRHLSN